MDQWACDRGDGDTLVIRTVRKSEWSEGNALAIGSGAGACGAGACDAGACGADAAGDGSAKPPTKSFIALRDDSGSVLCHA